MSVALGHARKYRYIETNAARDTLTKFGKGDKTPDPYTPEQVKALMQRVEGTVWEMPVILGGLYGMRRSEILGLRWRNVDLENNTFDVSEQLPFKVPPKTKTIEEMPRRGYLHSLENCLKIWKCHISVFTIYAIRQLPICTN